MKVRQNTRRERTCQWVTKASTGSDSRRTVCGSVLEPGEGLVLLQGLRKVLGALCKEAIVLQTASRTRIATSGGLDSRKKGMQQRTSVSATLSCS